MRDWLFERASLDDAVSASVLRLSSLRSWGAGPATTVPFSSRPSGLAVAAAGGGGGDALIGTAAVRAAGAMPCSVDGASAPDEYHSRALRIRSSRSARSTSMSAP